MGLSVAGAGRALGGAVRSKMLMVTIDPVAAGKRALSNPISTRCMTVDMAIVSFIACLPHAAQRPGGLAHQDDCSAFWGARAR
jgi:hypothetical protein